MRAISTLCLAASLIGCETRHQPAAAHKQATQPPPTPVAPKPPAPKPTVKHTVTAAFGNVYYGQVWFGSEDTSRVVPRLTLDGQLWQVQTAAQTDSTHQLRFAVPADKENHQPATVEVGAEVQYTVRLLDQHGRPRFSRQLRKADFAHAVYGSLRTVAVASAPTYLGYWPARRALAFEVRFGRDETDEGVFVLLLLDGATGRVLHLAAEKPYMGSCDCWPTLAPNGQTLLAGEELLLATGQVISLARRGREVAGTRIINDSTFLVVYESGDPNGERVLTQNTQLINRKGQLRRTFTFHGTDSNWASGGYSLEAAFVPATGLNYLFDGRTATFTLIPAARPAALQQLRARQLTRFQPPQRASEKKLEFEYNDTPTATLYVDTVTQKLRYADARVR